jgi:hypothetical protein
LFFVLVPEKTYIDRDELADFLSDHVSNDFPTLKHILGTRPAVSSKIEKQLNSNSSSITQAISDFLSDWNERTGLHESTVSLLCYGSNVPVGTGITEGLRKRGFVRAAGTNWERCKNCMNRHVWLNEMYFL